VKKYIFSAILLVIVAGSALIGYGIIAPSRAAARDLEAINGLTVGQTTESELLGRAPFQKADYACTQDICIYAYERENKLLSLSHLAPRTSINSSVWVSNGLVVQVSILIYRQGQPPLVVKEVRKLPEGCITNPCSGKLKLPPFIKSILMGKSIMFTGQSDYRNRFPQMVHVACLSHLSGCVNDADIVPISKELETKEITN
jgi:hypothetical protein